MTAVFYALETSLHPLRSSDPISKPGATGATMTASASRSDVADVIDPWSPRPRQHQRSGSGPCVVRTRGFGWNSNAKGSVARLSALEPSPAFEEPKDPGNEGDGHKDGDSEEGHLGRVDAGRVDRVAHGNGGQAAGCAGVMGSASLRRAALGDERLGLRTGALFLVLARGRRDGDERPAGVPQGHSDGVPRIRDWKPGNSGCRCARNADIANVQSTGSSQSRV